jgi:hypothetical protein
MIEPATLRDKKQRGDKMATYFILTLKLQMKIRAGNGDAVKMNLTVEDAVADEDVKSCSEGS